MTSAADRRWTMLVAMCLATAVTEFDETVMAVALPSIDAFLHALTTTMAIGAGLVAAGAVLALVLIENGSVRPSAPQVLQDA